MRLIGIDAPITGMHAWRQADTAAMARNFHENGYDFAHPQIDWGGESPGYVETEFPFYPYAVSILYEVFGPEEWLGRLLSVVFWLTSIILLFRLVERLSGERTAFWSALFFAFLPLNLFYSRAFMPESALLMSSVAGLYFFHRWTETTRLVDLGVSWVFLTLACLLKIPTLYLGLPLAYLAWSRFGLRLLLRPEIWIYTFATFASVGAWYYHAHQVFLDSGLTFGIWGYGEDKWGNWELIASWKFWNKILFKNLGERFLSWPGLILAATGLFLARRSRGERLFDFWLLSLVVYLIVVSGGNYAHEYYQLPFMIPVAYYMGRVFARFWPWWPRRTLAADSGSSSPESFSQWKGIALALLLLGTTALGGIRYASYLAKEDPSSSLAYQTAEAIRQHTEPGDLVISLDRLEPTFLYLARRKGWQAHAHDLTEAFVAERVGKGATYLVGPREFLPNAADSEFVADLFADPSRVVHDDGRSFVVDLHGWRPKP